MKQIFSFFALCFLLLMAAGKIAAQNSVGIGTESPNPKAVLELIAVSNNQGFLAPRLTTAERNSFGASLTDTDNGMFVFDSEEGKFYAWYNGSWNAIGAAELIAGEGISLDGQQITNTGDIDPSDDLTTTMLAAGDVTGTFNNTTVTGLGGRPLDLATVPSAGFTLVWDGTEWKLQLPAAASQSVVPNADLVSTSTQAALEELQNEILANVDTDNQVASEVAVNPSGNLLSTDVQASLEELQSDIDSWTDTDDQTAGEVPYADNQSTGQTDVQGALDYLLTTGDGDNDPGNEIQNLSITGNSVGITGGTGFDLAPSVPANGQVLKWNGTAWDVGTDQGIVSESDPQWQTDKVTIGSAGTVNDAGNLLDWSQLKNVPPGLADGVDDEGGDMLSATYDADLNGLVDDAELVNGLSIETAVPLGAVFTDDQNAVEVVYDNGTSGLASTDVQAAIDELSVGLGGTGDMLSAIYDADLDGLVDDAELVNGLTVETAVPLGADFTDDQGAVEVFYDNGVSGIASSDVQGAIDELNAAVVSIVDTDDQTASEVSYFDNYLVGQSNVQGVIDHILTTGDGDNDPGNEIQDLSISGNTVGITGGAGFELAPTTPISGQVLKFNGSAWDVAEDEGLTVVTSADITDFTITADDLAANAVGIDALDEANIPLNSLAPATADLSLATFGITDLSDPINPQDAATKAYVDLNSIVIEDAPNGTLKGGVLSGELLTSGQYNVLYGRATGASLTTESSNTMMGWLAGYSTTSSNNSVFGYRAGVNTITGFNNTFLGYQAGEYNDAGSDNVAIGANSGPSSGATGFSGSVSIGSGSTTSENEAIAIGLNATASASNAVALGANAVASSPNTVVLGNGAKVGIGTNTPVSDLQINDDFHFFHYDDGSSIEGEIVAENLYADGAAIRYAKTGPGSMIMLTNGDIEFFRGTSQSIGADAIAAGALSNTLTLRNDRDAEFYGAVRLGDVNGTPQDGMIRYNLGVFEGYDGTSWSSLTGLNLPFATTINEGGANPFYIENQGTGGVAEFNVNNVNAFGNALTVNSNSNETMARALRVQHTGLGGALEVEAFNSANNEPAILAKTSGTAPAGVFELNNGTSTHAALRAEVTAGDGPAIEAITAGAGAVADFRNTNQSTTGAALVVENAGTGSIALLQNTSNATQPAVTINNNGTGAAIDISSGGNTTRFGTDANFGGRVSIGHFAPSVALDINATDAIRVPAGTTGQRPLSPLAGMLRYNSSLIRFEAFDGTAWSNLTSPWLYSGSDLFFSTGNVGIGLTSPAEMLDVNGSVQVSGTGEYKYANAKLKFQSLHPSNFVLSSYPGTTIKYVTPNAVANYYYFEGGTANVQAFSTVQMQFPDGAIVTELKAWLFDNFNDQVSRVELLRYELSTQTQLVMATAEATNLAGSIEEITDNTVSLDIVDNSLYSYVLKFTGSANSADTRLYGARVSYTVTKAE